MGAFTAAFHGREKKMELHSEQEMQTVVDAVRGVPFSVKGVKRQDTSLLEAECSMKAEFHLDI